MARPVVMVRIGGPPRLLGTERDQHHRQTRVRSGAPARVRAARRHPEALSSAPGAWAPCEMGTHDQVGFVGIEPQRSRDDVLWRPALTGTPQETPAGTAKLCCWTSYPDSRSSPGTHSAASWNAGLVDVGARRRPAEMPDRSQAMVASKGRTSLPTRLWGSASSSVRCRARVRAGRVRNNRRPSPAEVAAAVLWSAPVPARRGTNTVAAAEIATRRLVRSGGQSREPRATKRARD